jgi:aldose 1-epimerase
MEIKKRIFGYLSNGKKVYLYTLSAGDLKLSLTNIGAAWTSLILPSQKGHKDDVLLGFSSLDGYLNNEQFFGVTVGRFANRIKDASFTLNGKKYQLEKNDGNNCLHSGSRGFDKLLWKSEAYEESAGVYVRFEIKSPDGDCGFPGNLKAVVSYGLTKSNEIIAHYEVKVDEPSPVNLTNHAYFNLAGEGRGNILSHEVLLHSSSYVETDAQNIPTGKIVPAEGNFAFKTRRRIDANMGKLNGYDHCFVVDGEVGKLRPCAEVYENTSGRSMKIFTTQPGVQFYTGNYLDNVRGKQGIRYVKHSGFCLETQHYPDTPNQDGSKGVRFPPCIARPDRDYDEKAVFVFDF